MKAMFVRNNQPGPTVFSYGDKSVNTLTWKGRGDPQKGDIIPVPAELADNYEFHRNLYLGVFELVEAEEEVRTALNEHRSAWRRTQGIRENYNLQDLGQGEEEGLTPREQFLPTLPETVDVVEDVKTTNNGQQATPVIEKYKVSMGLTQSL
jgi:hypothetical protein